jgi:hypothetical protein
MRRIDRTFAEQFLRSAEDFYGHGVHLLFNEWWEQAPADAIETYVRAIVDHPVHGPLAARRHYAEPTSIATLAAHAPGTLGAAWHDFMVTNTLVERLALGYRELHEAFRKGGALDRLPPVLEYKVLRGYQTHDLHHVLTGYPATPFGELALQAFGLAQMHFPYAAMWIAVTTAHMTFVDPLLIGPAMDAISEGWQRGRAARSIQFIALEEMLQEPLEAVRARFGLDQPPAMRWTDTSAVPAILAGAA